MADMSRIEDLRRRVRKDPASIAFAQLGEELRRAGELREAVEVCRAGLNRHPGYVSARVTLGRALIELNDLDNADAELRLVLKSAHDNLSAIRGRADISRRRGDIETALAQYRVALGLAPNDPELERWVAELSKEVGVDLTIPKSAKPTPAKLAPAKVTPAAAAPAKATPERIVAVARPAPAPEPPKSDPVRERALHTIAALERFLDAVHVVRAQQHT
ncbi:MAG TPA: tetratricopeptide repeat protein [Vicinamibacterales bacterium]|nr:tetratricopeptide repeat protein [Vicinamibacterales bacterium]